VRPEGYTDAKGRFSIQFGQNTFMIPDASVGWGTGLGAPGLQSDSLGAFGSSSGVSERDLMGCDLQASAVGYRSEHISLAGRRFMDRPDVGVIVLRRFAHVEGTTISITSLAAPKDAANAFSKGRDAVKKEKWADARKQFEKAVQVYPQYAAAWFELGYSLERLKDDAVSRQAYEKAIAADPKFLQPQIQLTGLDLRARDWKALVARTDQIIKLDPANLPGIYLYNSIGNYNLQSFEASEKSVREALKLDPQHSFPKSNHILGLILAQRGDFTGAGENLKLYLQLAPNGPDAALVKDHLAKVEQAAQGASAANR
jgi:tetratricopeptide (TPR) repeat protein